MPAETIFVLPLPSVDTAAVWNCIATTTHKATITVELYFYKQIILPDKMIILIVCLFLGRTDIGICPLCSVL